MPVVSGWSSSSSTPAATSMPGLVADRQHERDRQRAVGHRHVDGEVARLHHEADALLDARQRDRHRPQAGAVDPVDQAVAVRPEHAPSARPRPPAPVRAPRRRPRRSRPRSRPRRRRRAPRGRAPPSTVACGVHGHERRVRRLGQVGDGAVRALVARMHGVDRPGRSRRPRQIWRAPGASPPPMNATDRGRSRRSGAFNGRGTRATASRRTPRAPPCGRRSRRTPCRPPSPPRAAPPASA